MPTVGIYARLSLDRNGDQTATARQIADCRKYAELKGWEVAEVYEEVDLSAFSGVRRPKFEAMLADLEAGRIDGVLVWKLDRLCRRMRDFMRVWELCEQKKAILASFNESFDTTTHMGQFAMQMMILVAEMESKNISTRVKAAHAEQAARGEWTGGGKRPFGMTRDRAALVEEEAQLVREAVDRVLLGEGLRRIALDWTARGIKTTNGGKWNGSNLGRLLKSMWISGQMPDGSEAKWPAIVDRATAERLRAVLRDPSRRTLHTVAQPYLLTGIARCGRCGESLGGKPAFDQTSRRYVCLLDGGCGLSIHAEPLEGFMRDAVLTSLDTPALYDLLAMNAETDRDKELLSQLHEDEQALQEASCDHYVERRISRAEFLEVRATLEARIADARKRLERADTGQLLRGVTNLVEEWELRDVAWRRALVGAVVERVTVLPVGRKGPRKPVSERTEIVWRA